MKATRNPIFNQRGFSLIELMIAVAIIGILAAIAIPNYQKFQRKSRQSEAKSSLAAIYTSNKSYIAETGAATASFEAMGYDPEGRILYNCGWAAGSGAAAPRDPAAGNYTNVGLANSVEWCNGAANNSCVDGTADMGPAIAADPPNSVAPAGSDFTAACEGGIGGTLTDQWTIDQDKTVANLQNGVD